MPTSQLPRSLNITHVRVWIAKTLSKLCPLGMSYRYMELDTAVDGTMGDEVNRWAGEDGKILGPFRRWLVREFTVCENKNGHDWWYLVPTMLMRYMIQAQNKGNEEKTIALKKKSLRTIFSMRMTDQVRNDSIWEGCGYQHSMTETTEQGGLKWTKHTLRKSEEKLAKRIYMWKKWRGQGGDGD